MEDILAAEHAADAFLNSLVPDGWNFAGWTDSEDYPDGSFVMEPNFVESQIFGGRLSIVLADGTIQLHPSVPMEANYGRTIILILRILKSGQQSYKGMTRLGHSLSKYANRNPKIWVALKGNSSSYHAQAMRHVREIFKAPGRFRNIIDQGRTYFQKQLPDG